MFITTNQYINSLQFSGQAKTLILNTKDVATVEKILKDNRFADVQFNLGTGTVTVQIKNGHNPVIVGRIRSSLNEGGIYEAIDE